MVRRRDLPTTMRNAEIIRLRADGVDVRTLATRFDLSMARISQIWTKALTEMPQRPIAERRTEADEFIDRMIGKLTPLLDAPGVAPRTKAEVSRTISIWETRRAALLGLDMPRRREIEVISSGTVDRAIVGLTDEMTANAEYQRTLQDLKARRESR